MKRRKKPKRDLEPDELFIRDISRGFEVCFDLDDLTIEPEPQIHWTAEDGQALLDAWKASEPDPVITAEQAAFLCKTLGEYQEIEPLLPILDDMFGDVERGKVELLKNALGVYLVQTA